MMIYAMIHPRLAFTSLLATFALAHTAAAQQAPAAPSGQPLPATGPSAPPPAEPPVYQQQPPFEPPLPPPPPPPYAPPPPPPGSLSGDIPRFHDRFYLRLGLGGGTLRTSGTFDPDDGTSIDTRGGGFSFDLAIGGTPAPGFVIGGDYTFQQGVKPRVKFSTPTGSSEIDSNNDSVFGLLGIFADWFPDPRGGFHVGATLGLALLSIADDNGNVSNSNEKRGGGGALRVGYDFWVGDQWSIGILGQLVGASVSRDTTFGVSEHDSVGSFGLLVTALYH
jgi:hypothetical protein